MKKKRHLKVVEAVVLSTVLIVSIPAPGWVVIMAALYPRARRAIKAAHRSYRALRRAERRKRERHRPA